MPMWYKIALFLFIMNIFGGYLSGYASEMGLGAAWYDFGHQPTFEEMQLLEETKSQMAPRETISSTNPLSDALGWFYMQVNKVAMYIWDTVLPISKYVNWLPLYLNFIGIPWAFCSGLYMITLLVYTIGFYQFLTGREVER